MKKYLLVLTVVVLGIASVVAQEKSDKEFFRLGNRIGLGVGVGTEGLGIEAAVSLNKYFALRAGVNILPNVYTYEEDFDFMIDNPVEAQFRPLLIPHLQGAAIDYEAGVSAETDMKRTTIDVKVDFYPFPNSSSFFITGGFSFGGNELLAINGKLSDEAWGDINYLNEQAALLNQYGYNPNVEYKHGYINFDGHKVAVDENGCARVKAEVSKFRPYIGLGFGRAIPKKRVGVRFELGVQFHGTPKLKDMYGNDLLEQADLSEYDEGDIIEIVDALKFYPCMKLSIRGRIF